MQDERGNIIKANGPSRPISILGWMVLHKLGINLMYLEDET